MLNVKAIRTALQLTQEQLAQRMGVSFVTVSRWELGKSKPSSMARRQLERLANMVSATAKRQAE